MKKTLLLLLLTLSISTGFAQRKKNVKNPKAAMSSINVLASSGAMTVELSKNIFFVTLDTKKPVKDTIQLKKYTDKSAPMGCKLQSFTSKGQALYLVTWTDTYQKTNPLSKENITETN